MGHLVFVGDSYCAAYQGVQPADDLTQVDATYPTYLNLSAEWLGHIFFSFGYPGRSWWYSRSQLMKALDSQEQRQLKLDNKTTFYDDIAAFVFCHTDANRLNTSNHKISTALLHLPVDHDSNLAKASKLWNSFLVDGEFQLWAMERWFEEINRRFCDRPMIHFNVAPFTVEISRSLKGMVFTTPLLNVSIGEIEGTDKDVDQSLQHDQRYNHFNKHNQSAMARLIVDALQNYAPGQYEIDLVKYDFDQPNPNAWRWPGFGYGTR